MDTLKMQADLAKLQAEVTRVFEEVQKTNRGQWWLTPLVTACALLAVGAGLSAARAVYAGAFFCGIN